MWTGFIWLKAVRLTWTKKNVNATEKGVESWYSLSWLINLSPFVGPEYSLLYLIMKTKCYPERLARLYETTRCHKPWTFTLITTPVECRQISAVPLRNSGRSGRCKVRAKSLQWTYHSCARNGISPRSNAVFTYVSNFCSHCTDLACLSTAILLAACTKLLSV